MLLLSLVPFAVASNTAAEMSAERLGELGLLKGVGSNPDGGSTLSSAAHGWIDQSGYPVKLMWAYQSFDGDIPVGWDWPNSYISYLPADRKNGAEIIMETPAEGYVYEWVEISPSIQASIDRLRNP